MPSARHAASGVRRYAYILASGILSSVAEGPDAALAEQVADLKMQIDAEPVGELALKGLHPQVLAYDVSVARGPPAAQGVDSGQPPWTPRV